MRVLHLHDAPQILGGATLYLRRLIVEMAARGHRNGLFRLDGAGSGLPTTDEQGFVYQDSGSALRRRRHFHSWCPALADSLEGFLDRSTPDLVHVQNCAVFRATVFRVLRSWGGPVAFTVHDFSLDDPNPHGHPREGLGGAVRKWLDRRALGRDRSEVEGAVSRFLCPTEALQKGLRLPASRSRLLRLPIEPADDAPPPGDRLRLFFAGTLYRSKGVDVLLEALAQAQGPAAGAHLEIAGTGDQADALEKQVERLGLADRVRFLGQLDSAEMDAAYARANLQVLPSRVPENSPLTVLEAGARGRPSVASAAGGVPELLDNGRGFPFPSEDPAALAQVLERSAEDLASLAAVGARMRAWVRAEFDPVRHWDAVEAVYTDLAGGGGAA